MTKYKFFIRNKKYFSLYGRDFWLNFVWGSQCKICQTTGHRKPVFWHRSHAVGFLYKLKRLNLCREQYRLTQFLSNRLQAVVFRGKFWVLFLITAGSPQGSILSPFFFLVTLMTQWIVVETCPVSHAWSGAVHLFCQIACVKRGPFSKTFSQCVLINKISDFTGFIVTHPY